MQATDTALYASAEIKSENGFLLPGSVYALQTSNGHVLWQHHLEQSINGITLSNNVLYLNLSTNTDSTEIQALSANNGQHIWQKTVANGIVYGPKFLGADLYIAISNRILLLNTTNGQTLKTLPLPKEVQGFLEPFTPIFIV